MYLNLKFLRLFWVLIVGVLFLVGCGGGGSSSSSFDSTIHTQIEGDTLMITEEGTLKGLSVKGADASTDITQIQFFKVSQEPSRKIPSFVTKLSDFFVVEDGVDEEVFLRIPLKNLPKDIDLNHLYLYTLVTTSERINPFWSPILIDRNYVEKSDNAYLEFRLVGLKDNVYFIGKEITNSSLIKTNYRQKSYAPKKFPHITCRNIVSLEDVLRDISNIQEENGMCISRNESDTLWKNKTFKDSMICTTDEDSDIRITVHGFYHPVNTCSIDTTFTRWNGVTIEEMVSWIREAQKKLDDMGLNYNNTITVIITKFNCTKENYIAEYVNSDNHINIRDDNRYAEQMEDTIKHEYFHHAQNFNTKNKIHSYKYDTKTYTNCKGEKNFYAHRYTAWLMEGSADWFANFYKVKKEVPIILEKGLIDDSMEFYVNVNMKGVKPEIFNRWKDNPYLRSYFFQMLSSQCNSTILFKNIFDEILNETYKEGILEGDKSAIKLFNEAINSSECNFDFLGEKDNNLANVLLYYQYATAWQNNINLLDKKNTIDKTIKGTITFKKSKSYTNSLDENFKVPPYGVKSYIFKLSKFHKMTIDVTKNGLKYYLLEKASETGLIVNHADEVMVPLDKDREYFVVFVNDSEHDISGHIEISSSSNIEEIPTINTRVDVQNAIHKWLSNQGLSLVEEYNNVSSMIIGKNNKRAVVYVYTKYIPHSDKAFILNVENLNEIEKMAEVDYYKWKENREIKIQENDIIIFARKSDFLIFDYNSGEKLSETVFSGDIEGVRYLTTIGKNYTLFYTYRSATLMKMDFTDRVTPNLIELYSPDEIYQNSNSEFDLTYTLVENGQVVVLKDKNGNIIEEIKVP